jgi:glycerophosphoryl diester phosphodiesterase
MARFLDSPTPIAFAHRGGASDAPENSMAAFQHAVDLGYRYLETDAHVTADGVVLAFHDHELDRVTDRRGRIAELPWSEVSRARIDGREPIPRLDELLEAFPDTCVNIDAKDDAVVGPMAEVVARAGAVERVCVASFVDRRVTELRALLPGVVSSLGSRGVARLVAGPAGRPARLVGDCVQVPPSARGVPLVTRSFLARCHRLGLPVHVWTIDDPDEMRRLLDLGVDGLMTDRPAVLRDVLRERDQWPEDAPS